MAGEESKEEMKPGRELDALVAEKVMGCKVKRHPAWTSDAPYGCVPKHYPETSECGCSPQAHMRFYDYENGPDELGDTGYSDLAHYSTDIAAAWEIVKNLRERGFLVSIHSTDEWEVEFNLNDGRFLQNEDTIGFASATTASHAICLAALEAVRAK